MRFSDRTMSEFFERDLGVDIDAPVYRRNGPSKARRLRTYLGDVSPQIAAQALTALWEVRRALIAEGWPAPHVDSDEARFSEIVNRLGASGFDARTPAWTPPVPAQLGVPFAELKRQLQALQEEAPHARGYGFERFLQAMFVAHGLQPRAPFRLVGEQIDGSFQFANETYLLEAKWQAQPVPAATLHAFHGKLEEKAGWARGLFVSYAGFSSESGASFGRGKRLVCVEGRDLWDL